MAEAEKRIRFEDIFQEDVFAIAKASAEGLLATLKELDEALRKLGKEQAALLRLLAQKRPSVRAIKELTEAAKQAQNTLKALNGVQKALAQTEEKLKILTDENAKTLFAKRDEVKELTAALRSVAEAERAAATTLKESTNVANLSAEAQERLKAALDEVGNAYFQLSDRLNNLRLAYKNLAAAGKEGTQEAQALLLEITELDKRLKRIDESVGQFQRQVGSYTLSIRRFFNELIDNAEKSGGAFGQLIGFVRDLGRAVRGAGGGLRGLAVGVQMLSRALISSGIILVVTLLSSAIEKLLSAIQAFGERILGALTGETKRLLEQSKAALDYTRKRIELENQIAAIARRRRLEGDEELELLTQEVEKRKELLQLELGKAERERIAIEQELNEELGKRLKNGEKISELREQLANVEERIADLLREQADTEAELAAAVAERERKKAELAAAEAERLARLREELRARLRLEDEAASSKLEALRREYEERKRIADEVEAQAREQGLLDKQLVDELTQYRKEAVRRFLADAAELRLQALDAIGKAALEAQEGNLDAELALIRRKFAELRAELAQQFAETGGGPSAMEEYRRALDAIAEAENRELIRKQIEYIEQRAELTQKALETELDLQAKNFDDLKAFEEYKARYLVDIRRRVLEQQLQALTELYRETGSAEVETAIKEIDAQLAILKLQAYSAMQTADTLAENVQKRIQETARAAQNAINAVAELARAQDEKLVRRLERQQRAIESRINLLIAQAEAGAIDAEASIAVLEKQKAEAERQREAILKQQQRREAAISAFRSYASALASGQTPSQALIQVIRDFSVIAQLIKSLPTFYHGTEEVKPIGLRLPVDKDPILARLHPGERVVPADINQKLGGIPNSALPELVKGGVVTFDTDSLANTIAVTLRQGNRRITSKRPL